MPNFTIDQAHELVRESIELGTKHPGYARTVQLREDYLTVLTGNGWERFLTRFKLRIDKDEFSQLIALAHQNLSATSSLIEKKFGQISRVQDIKKGLLFDGTSDRDKADLMAVLEDFGGEGSAQRGTLDDYLTLVYDRVSIYDPNAFIVYDFAPFDANRGERARPYGIKFDCGNVLNFRYTRGDLDYLLVQILVPYVDPDKVKKTATDYLCFIGPQTIRYYEKADGRNDIPFAGEVWEAISKALYQMVTFTPGVPSVPAVRLGYVFDDETDHTTCVSPALHAAMDLFKELIDLKSTNDYITKKHGYPQTFKQAPACPGEYDAENRIYSICEKGINRSTGAKCRACGGSGHLVHMTEQDTLVMDLPEHVEDWADLSKLVFTVKPELETIKAFDEKIDKKKLEIVLTVFSSDQQLQVQSPAKTATEYVVSREDQNNTLLPFADQKSFVYKTSVKIISWLMNISGEVKALYEFARDLKLTTADEIIQDISDKATTIASPVLEQMYDDYYKKVYEADPESLRWYYFIKAHIPFFLLSYDQFMGYVASGYVTENDRTRRVYCDSIISDLQMTVPNILDLSYEEQETRIDDLVKAIQADLTKTVDLSAGIRKLNSADPLQQTA